MSGFTITITDAGRAALINAQNNGTTAFILSEVGVSTQAVTGPLKSLTALPNETKRLATMAGDVVANDTLHVTIRDESASAYALRAFGLYTSTGVLFAVYSQAEPIIEKSSAAMLLLAVDAKLLTLDTEQVEFGPVGFTLPPASETVAGITEVATDAEADAGTDNWRYITPRLLKRALSALSGFAALGHKHDAADIETGTFNASRIPSLAMSKITGLADALAGKAAAIHGHTVSQIEGLSAALAGKANTQHGHHADDISQGIFSVGRIPSLAMEKITGLASALAGKAPIDSADLTGAVRLPAWTTVKRRAGNQGGLLMLEGPGEGTGVNGGILFDFIGNTLFIQEQLSPWRGLNIDITGLAPGVATQLWTTQNFNPATKADANGWTNPNADADVLGYKSFLTQGQTPIASGQIDGRAGLEIRAIGTGAAYLCFHRPLEHAAFLGLDTDNQLKFGGWSQGAVAHLIYHSGNLRFATYAELLNASVGDRMLSPALLWAFPRAIGVSGYQQIPGTDLIIQWGVSNASYSEGPVHTTLPVAFGGGCLVAMAIPRNVAQNTGYDYYMQVVGRYQDRIVFLANRANTNSYNLTGYEWMAIGRATGTPDPAYGGGGGGGGGGEWPPNDGEMPVIP
ncbi:gp53-like domain-containing protein [Brevundimonas sp.]|uniref:gp53-like domain-containing protein n=1 Tax=Brevundimonas sp. TaxID=1871086 RepID=UPI0028A5ABFB|nr:hypothetical protein [Brevundimonas sp.]